MFTIKTPDKSSRTFTEKEAVAQHVGSVCLAQSLPSKLQGRLKEEKCDLLLDYNRGETHPNYMDAFLEIALTPDFTEADILGHIMQEISEDRMSLRSLKGQHMYKCMIKALSERFLNNLSCTVLMLKNGGKCKASLENIV